MSEIGLRVPRVGHRVHARRGAARSPTQVGLPGDHPARRSSSAAAAPASRTTPTRCARVAAHGLDASPISRDPHRAVDRGLEGVRARGHARPRRQRAWSSARSRTSTRWACTPATRSPSRPRRRSPTSSTSACATPRSRASAASASRPAARTSSSRSNPTNGDMVDHRDEPARVAQSARSRARRPASRSRRSRPSSRSATGSTRSRTTSPARRRRQLRADHRLRRHQGAALGVREVPRRDAGARHADAVGRRGRWRSAARSPSRCRRRCARSRPGGSGSTAIRPSARSTRSTDDELVRRGRDRHARAAVPARGRAAARRVASSGSHEATGIDPWFLDQILADRRGARPARRASGFDGDDPRATGGGPSGSASPTRQLAYLWGVDRGRRARRAPRRRRARHLQDRRHLRGRVRGAHAVPLRAPTRTRTRSRPLDRPTVVILGSGPEPHRPGRRVRLLLRARRVRAARRRLRDGHGQLQPRDRLDRLRHERPALLRAAHRRGRAQRHASALQAAGELRGVIVASAARRR